MGIRQCWHFSLRRVLLHSARVLSAAAASLIGSLHRVSMNVLGRGAMVQLVVVVMFTASLADRKRDNSTLSTTDCVRRSLCYHSLDCCFGCCIESQCVEDAATPCADVDVARNCSVMDCGGAECVQEPRFCLLPPPESPCPQPLPECRPRRPRPQEGGRRGGRPTLPPLPVQYPD